MAQIPKNPLERARRLLKHVGLAEHPFATLALCIFIAGLCVFAVIHLWPAGATGSSLSLQRRDGRNESSAAISPAPSKMLYIDVEGAVFHPTVYALAEGSRVIDAINAAGGTTSEAVPGTLNLARVLTDGEQVRVPSQSEQATTSTTSGTSTTSTAASSLININTADAAALQDLPGVGESTAKKIIADRQSNGPFSTVEDLQRVSGIGERKFAQMKDLICV